jgi:hypothetical protein
MSFGFPPRAPWCGAGAAVLLVLFGCSNVPTEPVRGASQRGQQNKPLHGVPEEEAVVELNVAASVPGGSNLIEFKLRGITTNRFFIDGSSLSVGRQGYSIRPGDPHYGGARACVFPGLRCNDRDWKDYAHAREDETWAPYRRRAGVRFRSSSSTTTSTLCTRISLRRRGDVHPACGRPREAGQAVAQSAAAGHAYTQRTQ